MADSPQTLLEFSENVLSDLERGVLTPQEALTACQQYEFLRTTLSDQSNQLSQASLAGDEELSAALKSLLRVTTEKLRDLPSFVSQEADAPLKEKDVRETAFLRTAAIERTRQQTQKKLAPYKEQRRAFIHSIVSKYSDSIPKTAEKNLDASLDRSLLSAAKSATTQQTKERLAEMLVASAVEISGGQLSGEQQALLKNGVLSALSANKEYIDVAINTVKSEQVVVDTLYKNLDVLRPDVLVDVVVNATDPSIESAILRGIKLARVAESLEHREGAPTSVSGIFTQSNARGATKGLQQAANGILSLVGEPLREILINEKINGTLRSVLTSTQQLSDRLGEAFVHTALFTQTAQNMSKSLSERPTTAQARSVFDDVFSSVFRGPLDPAIALGAKERIYDYFELARASANAPGGKSFLKNNMPFWEVFASSAMSQSRRRSSRSRSFFLPFFSFGRLGNFLGDLFSSLVDRTTSFVFSSPQIPNALSEARRQAAIPTNFFDDGPAFLAFFIIVVILFIYILPSPLNQTLINIATKRSEVFSSLVSLETTPTRACANINTVHIYQSDPKWAGVSCQPDRPNEIACTASNTECKIGPSGCGSASMAMILNAFGKTTSVETVWHEQHKTGGYVYYSDAQNNNAPVCATGNNFLQVLTSKDLKVSPITLGELPKAIGASSTNGQDCKKLVLASGKEGWGSSSTGHIIVITAISGDTITALDPARSESVSTLHLVGAESKTNRDFFLGNMWVVSNNSSSAPSI